MRGNPQPVEEDHSPLTSEADLKDSIAHSPGVAPLYYFSYLLFIGLGLAPFGPK